MSVPTNLNIALKKRSDGQIINMLDWAISGGPAKWCDDVTYSEGETLLTRMYITANNFTVNNGATLTLAQRRPLIVVADTIAINGTINASEKGCSAGGSDSNGYRYTGFDWPFDDLANQAQSPTRNYCLCGAGGGAGDNGRTGGGAYGDGGAVGSAGADCDLEDTELKELLFSPLFNIFQIGFGGGGGTDDGIGGIGGGSILLIGSTIIVGLNGNISANGEDGGDHSTTGGGGGGGGFVGLISSSLTVDDLATITANGGDKGLDTGNGSNNGGDGGDGVCVQIEV